MLRKLKVSRTAHVYSYGNSDEHAYGWIVCHGYGQLASSFIRSFHGLPDHHFVLAPEGLSKFYWNGFDGPVVASWMTREHREDEIADHTSYLHQIHPWLDPISHRVLLGFSQGVATAIRYLDRFNDPFEDIVLVGGWLPEDVDYKELMRTYAKSRFWILFGDNDPFYPKDRIKSQEDRLRSSGLEFQAVIYSGEHRVSHEALLGLIEQWENS